ncbi:MAG: aminotransferase class V-fold PLP-dependent enzyme [Actinomycetota bacterium]|nr:aminotransferase class V-fold PLP-dependent enzyme [Actinomycetota bacterium]
MTGVHLAHHLSTPLHPRAREAFLEALDTWGDPMSPLTPGREARAVLEAAREQVALALGVQPDEIVLTSGGTESISLGLIGAALGRRDRPCCSPPSSTPRFVDTLEHLVTSMARLRPT